MSSRVQVSSILPSGLSGPAALRSWSGQSLQQFIRRLGTRRALLDLDDSQLRDIGLSREQAKREALLPFWRL